MHKRRNIADHLPDKEQAWVDAKLVKAFNLPDPDQGLAAAKTLATSLDKAHPGGAASLREGLEQMFTVTRLGIDGRLAKTLTTSNPIESMISMKRPRFSAALIRVRLSVEGRVVGLLELHGRNVSQGGVEPGVVVPVHPAGGGVLDVGDGPVRPVVEDRGADALTPAGRAREPTRPRLSGGYCPSSSLA